jgi:hypothetical protein
MPKIGTMYQIDWDEIIHDDNDWLDCPVDGCKNRICLALKSDKCFVHTKGCKLIKHLKILLHHHRIDRMVKLGKLIYCQSAWSSDSIFNQLK